ncbi:MAG: YdeI/OmpD-associated family protein [Chitinophagaceae bacterium]|nr:YdeI/OmpD-associated family protein [Chitinophagaceae bacterium]
MYKFKAILEIIGINPFVFVREKILEKILSDAGKSKGAIPVKGTVNAQPYQQNLVKYKGAWRLYINTMMLKDSPRRIGEQLNITITFDPVDRRLKPHPKWIAALKKDQLAREKFNSLSPSLQKEIVKYILSLKTEESVDRNVVRAIDFLKGKGSFVGRSMGEG